ncbi:ATP synthase F1 subunit delta [Nitrospira sp. BLG_2]|uniref:ATP synthase F1 subunit delta n=1 Tax=Nitrospira sp. BLG_2 TaxID=3397507 RepID=UPI003B9A9490
MARKANERIKKEDMASEFDISQAAAAIYAQSLLELADEFKSAEQVGQELADLAAIWKNEPSFAAMMSSAAIDDDARRESLKKIFSGKLTKLVFNLLLVLNEHRRSSILPAVCDAYRHKLAQKLGKQEVFISTAVPLEESQRNTLREAARKILGREPVLVERVDPELLGGLIVQAGDRQYDTSIRKRLRDMRSALLASAEKHLLAGTGRFVTEG